MAAALCSSWVFLGLLPLLHGAPGIACHVLDFTVLLCWLFILPERLISEAGQLSSL
jgi:hypothetical protein